MGHKRPVLPARAFEQRFGRSRAAGRARLALREQAARYRQPAIFAIVRDLGEAAQIAMFQEMLVRVHRLREQLAARGIEGREIKMQRRQIGARYQLRQRR